jgi:hypothetical protein
MLEDFWNVKPPNMEGTKFLADDVCKFSNPSPVLGMDLLSILVEKCTLNSDLVCK